MQEINLKQLFYGAVTMGERGQVVVPAEARKACGMEPGDKLLVFGHPLRGGLFLAKVDSLQEVLADIQRYVSAVHENADEPG